MGLTQRLAVWTAITWLLTTGATNLDHLLEPRAHDDSASEVLILPMFPAYVANWIFDLLIFAITVTAGRHSYRIFWLGKRR